MINIFIYAPKNLMSKFITIIIIKIHSHYNYLLHHYNNNKHKQIVTLIKTIQIKVKVIYLCIHSIISILLLLRFKKKLTIEVGF